LRTSRHRMSSATSIVQRLTMREHSGQSLDVLVHQHFGFRMYCEWNGAFGNRSFERRFRTYKSVLAFCTRINTSTLEGACTCITRQDTFFDGFMLMNEVTICRVPLPLYPSGGIGHGPAPSGNAIGRRLRQIY
jgi:hypothetical protein